MTNPAHPGTRMPMFVASSLLLGALWALQPLLAHGSELEHVPWRSITVTSQPLAPLGAMRVQAEVDDAGRYRAFVLEAFGRSHALSSEQRAQLDGFPLSSLVLTHEAGYAQLGGHMGHARLTRTSYVQGRPVHEAITISVPQTAELRIDGPRPASRPQH
jgi:hypothetical protein